MDKPLKILAMPVDDGGCGNYRVRQPLKMIKAFSEHDTHVVDMKSDDMVDVSKAIAMADVVIVRQGGEEGIRQMKKIPEFSHIKWIIDIDDNIEYISPYSEHYKEYGLKEFYDPNIKQWVWKHGERGFDLDKNNARVASFLFGMQEADMITCTTEKLAEYAKQYNDNVAVLPNLVDLSQWWKLDFKPKTQLRIGWSGGVSHYEDWYTIKEPLNRLLRKYQFKLITAGAHFGGVIDKDLQHLVEVMPWVNFQAHSYRMMCMNLDIAIIPLADLPFNYYKSPIKYYEMCAMGIPSVVANVTPYKEELADDRVACYDTPVGFYNALERMINDETYRYRVAEKAYQWVRKNKGAKENISIFIEAYKRLTNPNSADNLKET